MRFTPHFCIFSYKAMPQIENRFNEKVFSLSEVTSSVKRTLNARYGSSFWVRAELVKLNYYPYSGHAFPDLIEKDGSMIVAQMRSVIWSSDYKRIQERFRATGLGELREGISVLVRASILFDDFYGLSLRIIDANPVYTLGEMEKERLLCIERLKAEGLFSLNKSRTLAFLPKRLAIISVESSKGYSDFTQVINSYGERYGVFSHLFPSLLQGEGAINTMVEAIERVNRVCEFFDALLIIRGGGGEAGLNCYNDYHLCKAIALCPLPVLTGIGHSTNQTIAEEISWHNCITPTDLADFVISRFREADQNLAEAVKTLNLRLTNRLSAEKERLSMSSKYLRLLSPTLSLQKGYTLTYSNDRQVYSKAELKKGDRITTKFFDGEISSIVE